MSKKILILGVGNILLCDEGFGVRAVEYLAANYRWPENVSLIDGGTRGLLLMSELMESDLAIVLDICIMNEAPGTILSFPASRMTPAFTAKQSAHQTGINDILISCELADHRPETIIFAIVPFDYTSLSVTLSPEAKKLLPVFCKKVVNELQNMGIEGITIINKCL